MQTETAEMSVTHNCIFDNCKKYSETDVVPDSIFVKILRAHLRNVSSTFSPVNALVSRNINSTAKPLHDITSTSNGRFSTDTS